MEKLLISIVGPTGVGKTALALKLARVLPVEVVSADTGAFYRETNIGTAKPSKEERSLVRHWFVDVLNCDERYSVASFVRDASQVIGLLWQEQKVPLIVAGTLFYYYALIGTVAYTDVPPVDEVRALLQKELAEFGEEHLRIKLRKVDPAREAVILRGDHRRLIRALEIASLGLKPSEAAQKNALPYHRHVKVGLRMPRELYRDVLRCRVRTMLQMGLIDEVEALLRSGRTKCMPCLSQIGYKEVCMFLDGVIKSIEELEDSIFNRHWDYAKRQMNWLRKDADLTWFEHTGEVQELIPEVLRHVEKPSRNS